MKCSILSDAFLSFGGKLFRDDGPAAEKLRGPKPHRIWTEPSLFWRNFFGFFLIHIFLFFYLVRWLD